MWVSLALRVCLMMAGLYRPWLRLGRVLLLKFCSRGGQSVRSIIEEFALFSSTQWFVVAVVQC